MRNLHTVSIRFASIYNCTSNTRICFSLNPLQRLFYAFLIEVILTVVGWYLTEVLMCVSPMTSDAEHFFMCLLTTYMSSLVTIQILCPFLIVFFMLLLLSCFSHVQLCATLWTVACKAPPSIGFPRQEYWNGLPCPPPGDLPDTGIEPKCLRSPAFAGGFFTTGAIWEALSA